MSNIDLEQALEPQPPKKSPAFVIIVSLLAVLLIAGGYWVARQIMANGEVAITLPDEIASAVNEGLRLEDGRLGPVRITSNGQGQGEVLPASQADPDRPSASGLIASPDESATGLMAGQMDYEAEGGLRAKVFTGADAIVTTAFVSDLANYLADNYWPVGTHIAAVNSPASTAGISGAGQRYGSELTGFATNSPAAGRDYLRERSMVLNYVYTPPMIKALSHLYADRFAAQLAQAGLEQTRTRNGKSASLSKAEVAEMLRYYADYARGVGSALMAYNASPGIDALAHNYTLAQVAAHEANIKFQEAQYLAESDKDKSRRQERNAAEALKKAEQEYRLYMLEQERAKEAVVHAMSRGTTRRIGDQSLLYIAGWASRRGDNAGASHEAAAEAAEFVANVLEEKAQELSGQ